MFVSLGAFLRVPARNDRDMWTFGLVYSSAGQLNFPLPLISYLWNPSDTFQLNIGLPFALTWRPTADWTINLSYAPLTNVNARVTYRALERLAVYGGYQFLTAAYLLADREVRTDRFFEFEQRLVTGLRWNVWRSAVLDLNAGYAFDRHYGEGRNQGSGLHDQVHLAPSAFLGVNLLVRF
jgi:hypothetical protein